ncbi:MAG: HU family DNA-binding protein [Boseongicola sp. SB0677_bin_26]|nr:HU family DNA-binding protein [Boseongicola sp. SB0665_bin_10]MYG26499.1 HU family DNA-binding protein [Boseongicola sp. SB0677_bin_26]
MAKALTKTQLVAALADELGSEKKAAAAALDAIISVISREVSSGGAVALPGVGKIYCRERPARMVRNPATGQQIHKDADKVVKMTIAKALKDSLNS